MFWKSVWMGFHLLLHWQVWLGMALYSAVGTVSLILVGLTIGSKNQTVGTAGCVVSFLFGYALEALILAGTVYFLFPLMLPIHTTLPYPPLGKSLVPVVTAAALSSIALLTLSAIPIVNTFTRDDKVQKFLQALIIFTMIMPEYINTEFVRNGHPINIYPDLFELIGYIIIGVVLGYVTSAAVFILSPSNVRDEEGNKIAPPGCLPLIRMASTLFGSILPLLMYSQYIRLMIYAAK